MNSELSPQQKRLCEIEKAVMESCAAQIPAYYNIPLILKITGSLRLDVLEKSICDVIARHQILRTRIAGEGDAARQYISQTVDFKLEISKAVPGDPHQILLESNRPFKMDQGPLLRGQVSCSNGPVYHLVLTLHHIIADRHSLEILVREILVCYSDRINRRAPALPPVSLHYADFSQWQQNFPPKTLRALKRYWKRKLKGDIESLQIPTISPPATGPAPGCNFWASSSSFNLDSNTYHLLKAVEEQEKCPPSVVLLAAFKVLLHRYSNQDDILVGTYRSNRTQAGTENIVGPVANLLALRTRLSPATTFHRLLRNLKRTAAEADKYQALPFQRVLAQLKRQEEKTGGDPGSLFNVLFQYHDKPFEIPQPEGLEVSHIETNLGWGNDELNLSIQPGDETFDAILVYNAKKYGAPAISRMITHYKNLLLQLLQEPDKAISMHSFLSSREKEYLLNEWNQTAVDFPRETTLQDIFQEQALKAPDHNALIAAGPLQSKMTYRELMQKAGALAIRLKAKGIKNNHIVGISSERSLEMMVGIFAILIAGAAYLPISPDYPEARVKYIIADSGTTLVLTSGRHAAIRPGICEILDLETAAATGSQQETQVIVPGSQPVKSSHSSGIAYVIYTSGSTGQPKGVVVEHHSVVNRLTWMQRAYPIESRDVILQKTPIVFDVSVWELFWWSFRGACLALLKSGDEKNPAAVAASIETYRVTTMHFVPSMLTAFLEYIGQTDDVSAGRLKSLRQVFSSGEALNVHQVETFNNLFKTNNTKLINLYGPTEATVDVSYFNCSTGEKPLKIPIGKPIDNIRLYVLDPNMQPVPVGIPGQLFIAGTGLARGYINNPGLTSEKFITPPAIPGERLYATGDLAAWLPDGNIEFLGRLDFQVKIRGFRIELGEIESCLLNHQAVDNAVVVALEDDAGDKFLCAYFTSRRNLPLSQKQSIQAELREYTAQALPEYMIPRSFVLLDEIPLTHNGKVDRKKLPAPGAGNRQNNFTAPQDRVEKQLINIWTDVLAADPIGIDDNFFQLGGHSLKATTLTAKVHKAFQVKITPEDLFKNPTCRQLARLLNGKTKQAFSPIHPVEKKEYYLQSSAQVRLYISHQMEADATGFNMPHAVEMEGTLDKHRLEAVLTQFLERHEIMRTSFQIINEDFVQIVHPMDEIAFNIEYHHITHHITHDITNSAGTEYSPGQADDAVEDIINRFIRPFDLSMAPLVRVGLITISKEKSIFMMDMHHIISDGTSIAIFIEEFKTLYQGGRLPAFPLQYKDYSTWQNQLTALGHTRQQEAYWIRQLGGTIPDLNLPTDYPRSRVNQYEGGEITREIDRHQTAVLKQLLLETETTMYMFLLAVYNILLSKHTGLDVIVVGTGIAGRRHEQQQRIVGMFVNMLVMKNHPGKYSTFRQFLESVKDTALDAFENQDYPFQQLVETLDIQREGERNPIFDAVFQVQNIDTVTNRIPEIELTGLRIKPYQKRQKKNIRFDLVVQASENNGIISTALQYKTALFKKSTAQDMLGHYIEILTQVIENIDIPLEEIKITSRLQAATQKIAVEKTTFGF